MFSIFSYKITEKHLLIAILLFGAILRFWGLGSAEIFHDEGLYAFRSIGYVDYIQNDDQTTPIQWFKDLPSLPWWTSLSFHDHPPLFFLTQNIFFKVLGDSLFAARLPSALAGILAIWFVYLIGKRMFKNKYFSFLAAFLLAVNHIHVWISRSSLMESLLIAAVLLNIYCFLQFLEDRKKWVFFGITLGLVLLTKYIGIFLLPVYVFYLILARSDLTNSILKNWRLYAAFGLALVIFLPVIVYNIFLYKATGHFDLQFAYLLNQNTPEWQVSFGKTQDPFSDILVNLSAMYSIPFLLLTVFGVTYSVFTILKRPAKLDPHGSLILFWFLNTVFITLMLIVIGSAYRFISLYSFVAVFFIVYLINYFFEKYGKEAFFKILAVVFLVYEIFFTIDGIFLAFPDFGVQKLDHYLNTIFDNQRSALRPSLLNPHLDKIIQTYANQRFSSGKQWMIVYDEGVALSTRLWVFARRLYYHGIPVNTTGQFLGLIRSQGIDAFDGYEIYFIKATDRTSLNEHLLAPDAADFENFLKAEQGLSPIKVIYGYDNFPMFYVYKILL